MEELERDLGIPPSRVVVGGFSQGGAVALLAAYHQRRQGQVPFAGCVCLSGELCRLCRLFYVAARRLPTAFAQQIIPVWMIVIGWLTLKDDLAVTKEVAQATPLFWGHGQWDDKVLFEQQAEGVNKLRALGVDVTDASYPMAHSSHPKELEAMAEFVEKVLRKA